MEPRNANAFHNRCCPCNVHALSAPALGAGCLVHSDSFRGDVHSHTLSGRSCRAVSHDKLGNHAAAVADFSAALEIGPSNASAYFNRGTCYDSLGQHDLATADFGRALMDFPSGQPDSKAGPAESRASQKVTATHAQVMRAKRLTGGADDATSRDAHSAEPVLCGGNMTLSDAIPPTMPSHLSDVAPKPATELWNAP